MRWLMALVGMGLMAVVVGGCEQDRHNQAYRENEDQQVQPAGAYIAGQNEAESPQAHPDVSALREEGGHGGGNGGGGGR